MSDNPTRIDPFLYGTVWDMYRGLGLATNPYRIICTVRDIWYFTRLAQSLGKRIINNSKLNCDYCTSTVLPFGYVLKLKAWYVCI